MNYENALETGKVVVRRVWVNQNSTKNQWSVQFAQKIDIPTEGTPNKLISIAQGTEGLGKNTVTSIMSFKEDQAKGLGLEVGDYFEGETQFANDIFGVEVNIEVLENTTPNPYSRSQDPKINPRTGAVLKYNGQDIYRHTTLTEGSPNHVFLQHDGVGSSVESPVASTAQEL